MSETETELDVSGPRGDRLLPRMASYLEREWLRCLLLILFGIGVRLPALQGELIWDDQYLAHDSPFIKSPLLILEAFRHYLFPESFAGHYRPVQNISYIFDYLVWNTDAYGFHLSNVLWHVASGILLYFLLRSLLNGLAIRGLEEKPAHQLERDHGQIRSLAAFLLALLWMVHPVHSAAIDYISGRADSLAFFFACGGWLLYLRALSLKRPLLRYVMYGGAALSALLSVCARESGFIWLALFLVHLFLFEKRSPVRLKLQVAVACLCVVAAYAGLRQLPEHPTDIAPSISSPAPVRVALMFRALGDYGRLLLFPTNLHMERTVTQPASFEGSEGWRRSIAVEYLSVAGLLMLAALGGGALRKGAGQRTRIFGASWFLLAYLPISNLVDLNATVAEHWLYLPSVGFFIFLAGVAFDLPARYRQCAVALACVAVCALSARSVMRSSDWVNPETFFRRTFAAGGSSTRIGVNLALVYSQRGDYAEAEKILRKVLQISPNYAIAWNNLADALSHLGKTAEAEAIFDKARKESEIIKKEQPRTWVPAYNLAHLLHKKKDDANALTVMEKVSREYPGTWELISYEAELRREAQGPDVALSLVEKFAHENWWHFGASLALGRLYSEKGETEKAAAAFQHASWLDFYDVEALNLLALMDVRQNRLQDAYVVQQRAVSRQPDQPRQYLLLSEILGKMGRDKEARASLAKIDHLQALAPSRSVAN